MSQDKYEENLSKLYKFLDEFVSQLEIDCYAYVINLGDCLSAYAPAKNDIEAKNRSSLIDIHKACMETAIDCKGGDGYICFTILANIDRFMQNKILESLK